VATHLNGDSDRHIFILLSILALTIFQLGKLAKDIIQPLLATKNLINLNDVLFQIHICQSHEPLTMLVFDRTANDKIKHLCSDGIITNNLCVVLFHIRISFAAPTIFELGKVAST